MAAGMARSLSTGSVAVLLRLGALEQDRHGWFVGDRAVPASGRDDDDVAGFENDGIGPLELDPERALSAIEELVLRVVDVPRELAVQLRHLHLEPVRLRDDDRLPRLGDRPADALHVLVRQREPHPASGPTRVTVERTPHADRAPSRPRPHANT